MYDHRELVEVTHLAVVDSDVEYTMRPAAPPTEAIIV